MGLIQTVRNRMDYWKDRGEVPPVTAIVVAAGKGERMGGEASKQLLSVCGMPVIARTLGAFENCRSVNEVVVVARDEDMVEISRIVKDFELTKVVRIVRGSDTRQRSALCGLEAAGEAAYFAIHDGARPLVSPECIDRVVEGALRHGAAAAAVRVKDTVKIADDEGFVLSTPDRSRLWSIQTPQVFEAGLYRGAVKKAVEEQADYTDDCQMIESVGQKIRLIEGEYTNLKITTPDDILAAEAYLGEGEESETF
ncbi:MAG TPA: 2-C-methyl-D-erythritol 4-phosphate cytidylyltransferase [Clostridia bacterium]|nr:2-C-methyl-D-erythritol 4-phosphate cytidylyltransferase [Clostridia bacterium]